MITEYFDKVRNSINTSELIYFDNIEYIEFDRDEGMLRGKIQFLGGYTLEVMEYITIGAPKQKYRYHLMDKNNQLVFRYDNAPHHNEIPTFPHHKHIEDGHITSSSEVHLVDVIKEVEKLLSTVL